MAALQIACEKKGKEINSLDQPLSQMSFDKERSSVKLPETEEKPVQTNTELQACKKEVCSNSIRLQSVLYTVKRLSGKVFIIFSLAVCGS